MDDATYMVLATSEAGAEAKRRRMCAALGLVPMGKVLRPVGRDRWMARAVEAREDAEVERPA